MAVIILTYSNWRFMTMRSTSCVVFFFVLLTSIAFHAPGAVASAYEQPLRGFAWSPRQIPVVVQKSPEYAHDAVLQAMQTWNLAQTWFSDTYHVSSRPYTFVEAQQLGESYVKVAFNQTQTRDDWALTSPHYWWNNDGVFYRITVSISIDLTVREADLSPLQLRSLATAALGFALGLRNTVFSEADLLNWYSVNHDVVVPSTLNLYAVALLSMVASKNDMPKSPVRLPGNIPYTTPSESAITESVSTTAYSDSCFQELGYDSGSSDSWSFITPVGSMFAVRFTPPGKVALIKARFYIAANPAPFNVRMFNADREPTRVTVKANPSSTGWFDVDVSSFRLEVNSDFYIALEYLSTGYYSSISDWGTQPGLGSSAGSGERSYVIFDSDGKLQWRPDPSVPAYKMDHNYMIRATVQTGYSLRVLSPYAGTTGSECYAEGAQANFSVPETVDLGPGKKAVFVQWKGDYQGSISSGIVTMTVPATVEATYKIQYELKVTSEYGNPQGSGWYDEGSSATFSVTSPLPVDGFVGMLGGRYVLDHWSGGSTASGTSASITMDGPKTVRAEWRTDYTIPAVVVGVIVATVAVSAVLLMRRNARRPRAVTAAETSSRYVEYLAKLEELETRGEISEQTYQKLKDEYWQKIPERNT